jgi:hypothetical protein
MDKKSKTFIDDLLGEFPINREWHERLKEDNKRLRVLIGEIKKKYKISDDEIEKLSKLPKPKSKAKK